MLSIRPNCEVCDKDLPADSTQAFICSYECTFCQSCVESILSNVCPNCGGGLVPRPIRPSKDHRSGVSLQHQLPSKDRVNTAYSEEELKAFAETLKHIPPQLR
ncbi:DUF1272 domain-containing protein [Marinomonas epiphytica]